MKIEEEIWKDVKGYEGYYMVSNLGRVKSLDREAFNGRAWHNIYGRILNCRWIGNGYKQITLCKNGEQEQIYLHRLVLSTFVEKSKNREVNHKNGIRDDNRLENLEWVTPKENMRHAFETGLMTNNRLVKNNETGEIYYTIKEAAETLSVDRRDLNGHLLGDRIKPEYSHLKYYNEDDHDEEDFQFY